jgi:hypothetical protein
MKYIRRKTSVGKEMNENDAHMDPIDDDEEDMEMEPCDDNDSIPTYGTTKV